MKNIVINGRTLFGEENFGIRRYTLEILKEMDEMISPGEVEIVIPEVDNTTINFKNIVLVPFGNPQKIGNKIKRVIAQVAWLNYRFPKYIKANNAVSVDTQLVFPLCGCDVIAIHDCIPELFPQMYVTPKAKAGRARLLFKQKRATKRCKLLITPSEFSKKDIMKFYSMPANKIIVVPNAWQHFERIVEDESVIERLGVEKGNYFFALGSRSNHKNARWILAAAAQNPHETFVITGSSLGKKDHEAANNHLENVIFTGYLGDEQVKALMHHCKAFIQPSLYEGFGIPPLEAMSVGADCIVARAGSLPEVYKDSVWYIDPEDYSNIDLSEIMSRAKASNDIILEEYSWKKSAEKLLTALRTLS